MTQNLKLEEQYMKKQNKKKCYVMILSECFPKTHSKAGTPTNFLDKILNKSKCHTIRFNYDLWKKRVNEINAGKAYLSVRRWTGKPYRSKQEELLQFYTLGIEKLEYHYSISFIIDKENRYHSASNSKLYKNDGLEMGDFIEWFKDVKNGTELAIIQFTNFKYV